MKLQKTTAALLFFLFFSCVNLFSESFRTNIEGSIEITPEKMTGGSVTLGINSSVFLTLGPEARFLRGIELEIIAPQGWLSYRGSLVMMIYNNISSQTNALIGLSDITANQIILEPLASRINIIYQIPVRQAHGMRTTTTVTVPSSIALPSAFPVLIRFSPVIKGLSSELENMTFNLTARPILNDEGAVRLAFQYPAQLANRSFTALIDDKIIDNIREQIMLKEGEHHLVILSDDYRNESRRFIVERAKVIDLSVELQDPTPVLIFEGPQNAQIFLNNSRISRDQIIKVEPGVHEVRFQVGDYTLIQTVNVSKGKTYRIALAVDLTVKEED